MDTQLIMSVMGIDVLYAERSCPADWVMGRESCIRMLAEEVAERWFPGLGAVLAASALSREAEEATYLGRGLAVPHARVAGLSAAAVLVMRDASVPWPTEPADCGVLLCVPEEMPELHLQLLSRVVRWRSKGGELVF